MTVSNKKERKMVSVNEIEKAAAEAMSKNDNERVINWHGADVAIKKMISFDSLLTVVNSVVRTCIAPDSGDYIPEVREFAMRNAIIDNYTNIRLPANGEKKYDILFLSGLYEDILAYIDQYQYEMIVSDITKKINYCISKSFDSAKRDAEELLSKIELISSAVQDTFQDIDKDDLKGLLEKIQSSDFSAETIVGEIAKQTANQASSKPDKIIPKKD